MTHLSFHCLIEKLCRRGMGWEKQSRRLHPLSEKAVNANIPTRLGQCSTWGLSGVRDRPKKKIPWVKCLCKKRHQRCHGDLREPAVLFFSPRLPWPIKAMLVRARSVSLSLSNLVHTGLQVPHTQHPSVSSKGSRTSSALPHSLLPTTLPVTHC